VKKFNTAKPKAAVNADKAKAKHKAVKGKRGNPEEHLQDKGVIDSSCSRHMIGNMSFLTYYKEIDGGYVAFGGNPKGGKITGKGKIKTGKLDFKNVYFVRELKFNIFIVSQICDKKKSVLFTDTECIVLSPDFKLIDENQILLRVPRQNNMYIIDLENIVPIGGLTCLFAKATKDESKLWYKRLGHLNFKTINKLVKGNLVRGTKDETSGTLKSFITRVENLMNLRYSVARTPQQNRVAERRNRILIEATRTMLADSKLPTTFWVEAVNTACYVQNKSSQDNEFQPLNDGAKKVDEDLRKENECNDQREEDSTNSTNRVNTVTSNINAANSSGVNVVGTNISIDLSPDPNMPSLKDINIFEDSHDDEDVFGAEADFHNLDSTFQISLIPTTIIHKDHPLEQVIGYLHSAPQTRRMTKNLEEHGLSAFLYGKIKKEVYVCQPPGFEDLDFLNKVYKVEKALYGLHQAPRAWDETLSTYLLDNGFKRGQIDKTLFIKRNKGDILLVQVYVDDIIFRSTKKEKCDAFEILMDETFQMSLMGELTFFLGLQTVVANCITKAEYVATSMLWSSALDTKSIAGLWTVVKIKTVNDDVRLQALIDGKKVVINEASIRHDLKLNDAEGTSCLSNAVIFKELARMGESKRMETEVSPTETNTKEHVPTPFNDPLPSYEDRMQLKEFMKLCTNLSNKVLDLESEEKSSKQGRKITDIDADAEVNLENVYNLDMAHEETVMEIGKIIVDEVSTAGGELNAENEEPVSAAPTNITPAQPIEATKITVEITTAPKAKGIVFHDKEESTTRTASSPSQAKDKGKGLMVEPKMPLTRIDQIALDEEVARRIEAEWNADMKDNIDWNEDNVKKQKLEEQEEAKELKKNLEIVPDDENDVFVNVTPLSFKPPVIMDY
nr:ribonuclease H-like domain-containing protein [Tanacetum cinerariifolium]